jgi:hypothetical protein
MALSLVFCRKFQQKTSCALKDINWITVEPILKLIFATLNKNGNNITPFGRSEKRRVIGNIKEHPFASKCALHLNFSLMLMQRRWIFDVFTSNKEFFDVCE